MQLRLLHHRREEPVCWFFESGRGGQHVAVEPPAEGVHPAYQVHGRRHSRLEQLPASQTIEHLGDVNGVDWCAGVVQMSLSAFGGEGLLAL